MTNGSSSLDSDSSDLCPPVDSDASSDSDSTTRRTSFFFGAGVEDEGLDEETVEESLDLEKLGADFGLLDDGGPDLEEEAGFVDTSFGFFLEPDVLDGTGLDSEVPRLEFEALEEPLVDLKGLMGAVRAEDLEFEVVREDTGFAAEVAIEVDDGLVEDGLEDAFALLDDDFDEAEVWFLTTATPGLIAGLGGLGLSFALAEVPELLALVDEDVTFAVEVDADGCCWLFCSASAISMASRVHFSGPQRVNE